MKKLLILGYPIKHSRSPLIYSYWMHQYSVQGSYEIAQVHPHHLSQFVRENFIEGDIMGGNATIPHKEALLTLVESVDETAMKIGAVNMLYRENGLLKAMNTDVIGYLDNCDAQAPHWDKQTHHALVLGAGGSARAIVYGLLQRGIKNVSVANRTLQRAMAFEHDFGVRVHAITYATAYANLETYDFIVNTTALGMAGQDPLIFPHEKLKPTAILSDIVYIPYETDFLKQGRARGHTTITGLGMLLHQAKGGFHKWFGIVPEVTLELEQRIRADLEKH